MAQKPGRLTERMTLRGRIASKSLETHNRGRVDSLLEEMRYYSASSEPPLTPVSRSQPDLYMEGYSESPIGQGTGTILNSEKQKTDINWSRYNQEVTSYEQGHTAYKDIDEYRLSYDRILNSLKHLNTLLQIESRYSELPHLDVLMERMYRARDKASSMITKVNKDPSKIDQKENTLVTIDDVDDDTDDVFYESRRQKGRNDSDESEVKGWLDSAEEL